VLGWPAAVKAVVLSPTHELAAQQMRVLQLLLPGTGLRAALLSKATAAGSDWRKVDVLVGNPLRLLGLVTAGALDLSQVGAGTARGGAAGCGVRGDGLRGVACAGMRGGMHEPGCQQGSVGTRAQAAVSDPRGPCFTGCCGSHLPTLLFH
jgi:hypothetical protein